MNQQGSAGMDTGAVRSLHRIGDPQTIPSGKGGNKFSETGKTYIPWEAGRTGNRIPASEIYGPALDWEYRTRTNGPWMVHRWRVTWCRKPPLEPYGAHAGGSPDGLVGELGIIEIKCPFRTVNHFKYRMARTADDLPPEYFGGYKWTCFVYLAGRGATSFRFRPASANQRLGIFILRVSAAKGRTGALKSRIADAVLLLNQYRE